MTLATQCPHCKTTFRVAQDQLKLRAGLVRCGACKEIFNGTEHLLANQTAAPLPTTAKTAEQAQAAPPVDQDFIPEFLLAVPPPPVPEPAPPAPIPLAQTLDFVYPDMDPLEAEIETEAEIAVDIETETEAGAESETVEFVDFVEIPRKTADTPHVSLDDIDAAASAHAEHEEYDSDLLQHASEEDSEAMQLPSEPLPSEPYLAEIASPAEETHEEEEQEEATTSSDMPDPLDQVIEELQSKPPRSKKAAKPHKRQPKSDESNISDTPEEAAPANLEQEEPEFLKQGRRKQRIGRTLAILTGLASFILLLCALSQAVYIFRDQIAARAPEAKPTLVAACSWLNCAISLPAQIENITIESDELDTLTTNKDDSVLALLLRNVGPTAQTWPHIELTLNDSNGSMLARRVFAPREYFSDSQEIKTGLPSNSEQPIKLYVAFSGVKPAGYHVRLFYP